MNSVLLWKSMNSVLLWNNLNYTELSPAPLKSSFGSQTISPQRRAPEENWSNLAASVEWKGPCDSCSGFHYHSQVSKSYWCFSIYTSYLSYILLSRLLLVLQLRTYPFYNLKFLFYQLLQETPLRSFLPRTLVRKLYTEVPKLRSSCSYGPGMVEDKGVEQILYCSYATTAHTWFFQQ